MKTFKYSSGKALFIGGIFLWAFAFILTKVLHFSNKVFMSVFIVGLILELIGVIIIIKHAIAERKKH